MRYISRGAEEVGAWKGCPHNLLLFDLKKVHFGAVHYLN